MVLLIGAMGAALAGDVQTWVGGGVSAGLGAQAGEGDAHVAVPLQAELDFRAGGRHWFTRVDADVHLLPVGGGGELLVYPFPIEWAMFQVGAGEDPYRIRLGLHNPAIGLEDWDEWNNYLPTFSILFNGASPGRIIGGEVAWHLADGTEVFAWGGGDTDFYGYTFRDFSTIYTPTFGVGVTSEQDSFGTWSGFAAYPGEAYYGLFGSLELYLSDAVWLTLDGAAGTSVGAPYAGAQLVLNVLPEGPVAPVARVEGLFDPDDLALGGAEYGVYDGTTSLGVRLAPGGPLLIQAEAKVTLESGKAYPGAFLMVHAFAPEPPYYEVSEPAE